MSHCRGDNGRFGDAGFKQACTASRQTLYLCALNGHHQNGIAESSIGYLQSKARSILLHAINFWTEMISAELWTLAMLEATRISKVTCFNGDGKSPLAVFSKSFVHLPMSNEHTFGCPVCVLKSPLQAGSKMPKWALQL